MPGSLADLLALGNAEVGVGESPPGSNVVILRDGTNLWRDFYGLSYEPHWAWCACFQSWLDWKNGTQLPAIDFPKGYIGVDNGRAWFGSHGLLVPQAKVGYLAFYNEHTGRVFTDPDPNGYYTSLEGNEGDAVRLVQRHVSESIGGFGVREYGVPTQEEEEVSAIRLEPGQSGTLYIDPNRKSAVILTSDFNGANVRVAIGSGRPGGSGFPIIQDRWIPNFPVGYTTNDYGKAELVSVVSYPKSSQPVTVTVEYA